MVESPRVQLDRFGRLISGKRLNKTSPTFAAALEFMRTFPGDLTPEDLTTLRAQVCEAWSITEGELDVALTATNAGTVISGKEGGGKTQRWTEAELQRARQEEEELDHILPSQGFFRDYIEYTRESEAPMAYHFFTGVVGLAATVNRRVGFSFGPTGTIYPPLGIILLGPSGIKKTSSSDIIVGILTDSKIVPIYSEKVTPEALIDGMKKGQAVGLIYAPEMSVFLGKQSYMEGVIPLLTRLMDSPDKWTSATISRGETTLTNVALTSLMCSTSDWFVGNTPPDMFGGGFIARNLLVHQTISPRVIPIPQDRSENRRTGIINKMMDLHTMFGTCEFSPEARAMYVEFYQRNKFEKPEHEMLESYHQRKAVHSIRLSMLLHMATCGNYTICAECYDRTLRILAWNEKFLPSLLKDMFRSDAGIETDKVLRLVRGHNGPIPHSTLIRKLQYCMNAEQVKRVIKALKESNEITEVENKFAHTYELKEGQ